MRVVEGEQGGGLCGQVATGEAFVEGCGIVTDGADIVHGGLASKGECFAPT